MEELQAANLKVKHDLEAMKEERSRRSRKQLISADNKQLVQEKLAVEENYCFEHKANHQKAMSKNTRGRLLRSIK